jgi:hypothetical protein
VLACVKAALRAGLRPGLDAWLRSGIGRRLPAAGPGMDQNLRVLGAGSAGVWLAVSC